MRLRIFLAAVAVSAIAMIAFALSPEYTEWGRGPVSFVMTKDEAAKWKTITSDEDAKAFAALFWARRDPTPGSARNEYREEFDRRVAQADKNFPTDKKRGAMTERGKIWIIFGQPKRIERTGNDRQSALPGMAGATSAAATSTDAGSSFLGGGSDDTTAGQIWTYEGEDARALFGQARAPLRFVDRQGKSDFTLERGGPDVSRATQKAIEKSITQPNLTSATQLASAAPAAATASIPEPALPVVQTELTTDSLKTAVAQMRAASSNPYANKAYATWGQFVTADGEYFVPVQLYVPKSAAPGSTENLTFFGVVQGANGTNVAAFEEPAKLTQSKDDWFVDRSFNALPAGKYTGVFGLADSSGKVVTMASTDLDLAGSIDKTTPGISTLLLSNNVFPLPAAQRATDPYAFGGLKVVPKGDRTFRPSDELWYFAELRNPGVAEAVPAADGTTPAAGTPKVQVKIDVEGVEKASGKKIRRPAPPREIEAIELKGVPGHYGIGNAIPLTSFKAGDYTFNVKIIDTVSKASYTLSEKFTVVE